MEVACLASVIQFYGGEQKLEHLRELSGTLKTGTTLLGYITANNFFGLQAEPYEADIQENLQKQEYPCILYCKGQKLQHYVLCYGFEDDTFLINDPAFGIFICIL